MLHIGSVPALRTLGYLSTFMLDVLALAQNTLDIPSSSIALYLMSYRASTLHNQQAVKHSSPQRIKSTRDA